MSFEGEQSLEERNARGFASAIELEDDDEVEEASRDVGSAPQQEPEEEPVYRSCGASSSSAAAAAPRATVVATASGTRWNLRLKSGELLALKPSNLEALESGPSMQKMIDALERAGEIDKAAMLRSVLPDADA